MKYICLLTFLFITSPALADSQVSKQSGCCSSHGGVGGCQSSGFALCSDGWTGSSCSCSAPRPVATRRPTTVTPVRPVIGNGTASSGSHSSSTGSHTSTSTQSVSLAGTYSGSAKLKSLTSNDPNYLSLEIGESKKKRKLKVTHRSKSNLKLIDDEKDSFKGKSIKTNSFYVSDTFDLDDTCTLQVTYTLKNIKSTSAKLTYKEDIVCDGGLSTKLVWTANVTRKR